MKMISLKEMQQIELMMLIELDEVCRKHGLRYFLDGGTLLGAMCYKGFIPWDDDIDLKMPRPDYERFLTLQQDFPDHIRLEAPSPEHCEYTMLKMVDTRTLLIENNSGMIKKTGVYIDIFPMDGFPEKAQEREAHIRKLQRYNTLFHMSLNDFSSMKQSASGFTRLKGLLYEQIYSPWKLFQSLTRLACRYDYESASNVGLLIEGDPIKECFEKSWLEPGFEMEFEGYSFPAPSGYKKHMEIFYGEHVTKPESYYNLPRFPSQHKHKVYWRESMKSDQETS